MSLHDKYHRVRNDDDDDPDHDSDDNSHQHRDEEHQPSPVVHTGDGRDHDGVAVQEYGVIKSGLGALSAAGGRGGLGSFHPLSTADECDDNDGDEQRGGRRRHSAGPQDASAATTPRSKGGSRSSTPTTAGTTVDATAASSYSDGRRRRSDASVAGLENDGGGDGGGGDDDDVDRPPVNPFKMDLMLDGNGAGVGDGKKEEEYHLEYDRTPEGLSLANEDDLDIVGGYDTEDEDGVQRYSFDFAASSTSDGGGRDRSRSSHSASDSDGGPHGSGAGSGMHLPLHRQGSNGGISTRGWTSWATAALDAVRFAIDAVRDARLESRRRRAERLLSMSDDRSGVCGTRTVLCLSSWCDLTDRGILLVLGVVAAFVVAYWSLDAEEHGETRKALVLVGILLILVRCCWRPAYWFVWGQRVAKRRAATMELYDGLNGEHGTGGIEIPMNGITDVHNGEHIVDGGSRDDHCLASLPNEVV